jgi:3'-phosphoadenosine 5'-phosphosulfate sulfotransferase (PAPS reductase)/FAD synthetase
MISLKNFDIYDCFFSGGRDSALTCYIAKKVADSLNIPVRLIHIDTGIYIPQTREYVKEYANWLNVELKIIKTSYDYFEKVKEYGYPNVFQNRWCWRLLKKEPLYQFRIDELKEKLNSLWILGIRRNESLFRLKNYGNLNTTLHKTKIKQLHVIEWLPILFLDGKQVEMLIQKFKIPKNEVWEKVGISGECLCLAGTTKKKLEAIFLNYPEIAKKFHDFDKSVMPRSNSKNAFRPPALINDKRLYEFIEELDKKPRQKSIIEYFSCQGSCMILK